LKNNHTNNKNRKRLIKYQKIISLHNKKLFINKENKAIINKGINKNFKLYFCEIKIGILLGLIN